MMKIKQLAFFLLFLLVSCNNKDNPQPSAEADKSEIEILKEKENTSRERKYTEGKLIGSFMFEVETTDPEAEDGITPWASIEKPEQDAQHLIKGNDIIIPEKTVTVIIDYPLKNEYRFTLESNNGFTRKTLLTEISRHYHKLYQEEEETATIKTLPMDKRTIANRNETNGKYGIWGHDIGDLVLTDIYVYRLTDGKIILRMNVDS